MESGGRAGQGSRHGQVINPVPIKVTCSQRRPQKIASHGRNGCHLEFRWNGRQVDLARQITPSPDDPDSAAARIRGITIAEVRCTHNQIAHPIVVQITYRDVTGFLVLITAQVVGNPSSVHGDIGLTALGRPVTGRLAEVHINFAGPVPRIVGPIGQIGPDREIGNVVAVDIAGRQVCPEKVPRFLPIQDNIDRTGPSEIDQHRRQGLPGYQQQHDCHCNEHRSKPLHYSKHPLKSSTSDSS